MSAIQGRDIVVCGATGKQGGAVVDALLASNTEWGIKALTRNVSSPSAKALAQRGVSLVAGDLAEPSTLEQAFSGAYGVFSVQANFASDRDAREIRYGKNVVDAAKAAGVRHLVYTSVGGAERRSGVPHFEAKRLIETHLLDSGIPATILRPATFMDNFASIPMRIVLLSLFKAILSPETKLQLIAATDIGKFTAKAFEERESYIDRQIELAGDSLTVRGIVSALRLHGIRPTFGVHLPGFLIRRLPEDFLLMVRWFEDHGFRADINALKTELRQLQSFEDWLRNQPS